MNPELNSNPSEDENGTSNETLFSELNFTLPEFVDFLREAGDEAVATEFEAYSHSHRDDAHVRALLPNDPNLAPVIEVIFD